MGGGAQVLRKALGLGDTLGALPIQSGGTGYNHIVDNTQLQNYLTGDGATSLTGNEPVFVSNLAALNDVFNVAGKQILSLVWSYYQLDWNASGITPTTRSITGFDSPKYTVHTNNNDYPYYNNAVMTSKCQKSGTYQVDASFTFYRGGTEPDSMRRQFILTFGSQVVNVVNDSSYVSFSNNAGGSYNEMVNLKENDVVKVEAGVYTTPFTATSNVDLKITRVS